MIKTRMVLLFIAAFYLGTALVTTAQSLDTRISLVEQKLNQHIQGISDPALARLNSLEVRVQKLEIDMEGQRVLLEASYELAKAVAIGVFLQVAMGLVGLIASLKSRFQTNGDRR